MSDAGLIPILREGIETVKLIVFQRLKEHLADEFGVRDGEYVKKMAAALINELFGQENPPGPFAAFAEENASSIRNQLEALSVNLEDMRIPLTDALRIQFLCDHQEGIDSTEILERADKLGILMTDREVPLPAPFIHMVRKIGNAFNLLDVTHKEH